MKDDGGPAFPLSVEFNNFGEMSIPDIRLPEGSYGMSLRDWFAGQALQGMLHYVSRDDFDKGVFRESKRYSGMAYELADAMLAERSKK